MKTFPCCLCKTMTIIEYKDYSFWEDSKKHTIPKVKHYVCPECGEIHFDSETSEMIDKELEKIRNNTDEDILQSEHDKKLFDQGEKEIKEGKYREL